MAKRVLAVFLILFFALRVSSWGKSRAGYDDSGQLFFYMDGGWNIYEGPGPDDGFSVGGGIGGFLSRNLVGKFNLRYNSFEEETQRSWEWSNIKIVEFNLVAQLYLIPAGSEIEALFLGACLGIANGKFERKDLKKEKWFLTGGILGGIDFHIAQSLFITLSVNYLFDAKQLFGSKERELKIDNMRFAIGFGTSF